MTRADSDIPPPSVSVDYCKARSLINSFNMFLPPYTTTSLSPLLFSLVFPSSIASKGLILIAQSRLMYLLVNGRTNDVNIVAQYPWAQA